MVPVNVLTWQVSLSPDLPNGVFVVVVVVEVKKLATVLKINTKKKKNEKNLRGDLPSSLGVVDIVGDVVVIVVIVVVVMVVIIAYLMPWHVDADNQVT